MAWRLGSARSSTAETFFVPRCFGEKDVRGGLNIVGVPTSERRMPRRSPKVSQSPPSTRHRSSNLTVDGVMSWMHSLRLIKGGGVPLLR